MTATPEQIMAEALEAIVAAGAANHYKYEMDAEFHAVIKTAKIGLEAARRATPTARAIDGRTEAEAREAFPPNCPRCSWVPVFGLMRCLPCALAAMAQA